MCDRICIYFRTKLSIFNINFIVMKLVAYFIFFIITLFIYHLFVQLCLSVRPSLCNARRACPNARSKDMPRRGMRPQVCACPRSAACAGLRPRVCTGRRPGDHNICNNRPGDHSGLRPQAPGLQPATIGRHCSCRPPPRGRRFHFFYTWDNSTFLPSLCSYIGCISLKLCCFFGYLRTHSE